MEELVICSEKSSYVQQYHVAILQKKNTYHLKYIIEYFFLAFLKQWSKRKLLSIFRVFRTWCPKKNMGWLKITILSPRRDNSARRVSSRDYNRRDYNNFLNRCSPLLCRESHYATVRESFVSLFLRLSRIPILSWQFLPLAVTFNIWPINNCGLRVSDADGGASRSCDTEQWWLLHLTSFGYGFANLYGPRIIMVQHRGNNAAWAGRGGTARSREGDRTS